MTIKYLSLSNKKLAYHLTEGKSPTVIFMGGFKSDMQGAKALALEQFCQSHGQRFIRFDYTGHGQSSGDFMNGTIGAWKQDALDIVNALVPDKMILVGSSMGAWIALLAIQTLGEKVAGFIGIASAPDFTEDLIWNRLNEAQKKELLEKGVYYAPSCYGEAPYPITKQLIEEGRKNLLLSANCQLLTANFPIRLLHGTNDADVPWQHSVMLMERIKSDDVQLILIKNGAHRLSAPEHLQTLCDTLGNLL